MFSFVTVVPPEWVIDVCENPCSRKAGSRFGWRGAHQVGDWRFCGGGGRAGGRCFAGGTPHGWL